MGSGTPCTRDLDRCMFAWQLLWVATSFLVVVLTRVETMVQSTRGGRLLLDKLPTDWMGGLQDGQEIVSQAALKGW